MQEYSEKIFSTLKNIEEFKNIHPVDCKISRLGGLTNLVHLVETEIGNVIVRIPGKGTEKYINRANETANATAAWRAGISSEILWSNTESGLMVSREIEGAETMTPSLFKSKHGAIKRAGEALAKLHNSGEIFEFRFELFDMIDNYLGILSTKNVKFPDGYHDIIKAANPAKEALKANPVALVPCHCDPVCENFLDDGKVMWIVDWEYSGMNDPLWDLGDLSVEAKMNEDQESELLLTYFGTDPTAAQKGRIVIYKAMCDLLWTLWGLIQLADGNQDDDFWLYSKERFNRCKNLMGKPDFKDHIKAIK